MSFIKIIQGNAQTSLFMLRILGFIGVLIGISAHFGAWHTIENTPKNVIGTGFSDMGMIGISILAVYALLLSLNSTYALLFAIVFIPYTLEQVIGVNLLRYMPLATTKLHPALYMYLPFSAILILLGSFAPILHQFSSHTNKK